MGTGLIVWLYVQACVHVCVCVCLFITHLIAYGSRIVWCSKVKLLNPFAGVNVIFQCFAKKPAVRTCLHHFHLVMLCQHTAETGLRYAG